MSIHNARIDDEHGDATCILLGHLIIERKRALIDTIETPGGGRSRHGIHSLIQLHILHYRVTAQCRKCRLRLDCLRYRDRQGTSIQHGIVDVYDRAAIGFGESLAPLGRADGFVREGDEIGLAAAAAAASSRQIAVLIDDAVVVVAIIGRLLDVDGAGRGCRRYYR